MGCNRFAVLAGVDEVNNLDVVIQAILADDGASAGGDHLIGPLQLIPHKGHVQDGLFVTDDLIGVNVRRLLGLRRKLILLLILRRLPRGNFG